MRKKSPTSPSSEKTAVEETPKTDEAGEMQFQKGNFEEMLLVLLIQHNEKLDKIFEQQKEMNFYLARMHKMMEEE